jgi:hypothetical protein
MAAPINPFTPPAELHALLPAPVVEAIAAVDALAARVADAQARIHEFGNRAENPDRHYDGLVRAAVASGGSAADVPDDRARWVEGYRLARADKSALNPLLEVAWRDLRGALVAHRVEALAAIEPTITEAAKVYAKHIDGAETAAAEHRARTTIRQWVATADRNGGPDPYKPSREVDVVAGKLRATPSEAIGLLRADANSLTTIQAAEAKEQARRAYNDAAVAKVAAAAKARDAQELAAAKAHKAMREATRVAELERTAAREAAAVPGTPAA